MGAWSAVVNGLVFAFATFFVILGLMFLYKAATTEAPTGAESPPSPDDATATDRIILGIVFLLAAAPMYFYLFSKNARGLPPPHKKPREPPPS